MDTVRTKAALAPGASPRASAHPAEPEHHHRNRSSGHLCNTKVESPFRTRYASSCTMNAQQVDGSVLTREAILRALSSLSDRLGEQGVTGELCLFGGRVMVLAFTARLSTRDVDALFEPTPLIRDLAGRIGQEQSLPTDWLNDAVKGFLSARHETTAGNLPQFLNLRLTMPVTEYLLAMKCMAARLGGTTGGASDVPDIVFLIRHLKLRSAAEVLEIVGLYYPANRIPVKTQYLVEGLFEEGEI